MIAINPRQRHAASFERIGGRFAGRRLPAARGARANSEDSDSDGGDANFVVCGGQIAGESSVEDEYAVKRLWAKQRINAVVFFLVDGKISMSCNGYHRRIFHGKPSLNSSANMLNPRGIINRLGAAAAR
ncbi:hypothetical protein PC110_g18184 [Phytophthora cactorum]|uniref:Uncharacterized protein n=1 Tax=Phytophthora cactorum TaxID=29920 RepID=A0A329RLB7_9STRA|nr:hypothetical protein PC110_g18184 [Phytophthora cactorum]